MRKRRVGVTARSRQIEGKQATGSPQVETEMAAPLELRTPMGTAAKAANRVRMEAWRQWRGSQSAEDSSEMDKGVGEHRGPGRQRAWGALEALPQTPPGGKPPETPGPLSLDPRFYGSEEICQGFASRAHKPGAPLTDSLAPQRITGIRERGLCKPAPSPASRWSALKYPPRRWQA